MAATSPAESLVAVSFGHYLAEQHTRAEEILALKELPLDDAEVVVGAYPLGEHGRTAAALSGYLAVNSLQDQGADIDRIVTNVYQHGLRLHAIATALGKVGIVMGARDISGNYHKLTISSGLDELPRQRNGDNSVLGALMDVTQDNLDEAEKAEYELAALLGNEPGSSSVRGRLIGMHAIHVAALEGWQAQTGYSGADMLNIGAQLYCLLVNMQQNGAQQLFLIDRQWCAIPLPEDLNRLAIGDNNRWLEACGPAVKLS